MPRMTRTHYNLVADAVSDIIAMMAPFVPEQDRSVLKCKAATRMALAVAGTNSQFKADRFKARCLGIRGSR